MRRANKLTSPMYLIWVCGDACISGYFLHQYVGPYVRKVLMYDTRDAARSAALRELAGKKFQIVYCIPEGVSTVQTVIKEGIEYE